MFNDEVVYFWKGLICRRTRKKGYGIEEYKSGYMQTLYWDGWDHNKKKCFRHKLARVPNRDSYLLSQRTVDPLTSRKKQGRWLRGERG